jgi:hypothetical protein
MNALTPTAIHAKIGAVEAMTLSVRAACPDHPEGDVCAAARELVSQGNDFGAASFALQDARCWGAYQALMAYRAVALGEVAA